MQYILQNEIIDIIRKHAPRIKTEQSWYDSDSKGLTDYLNIGDLVDETFASYFLNSLPPIIMEHDLIMMGGAFDTCPETGHNTYLAIKKNDKDQWVYIGEHTRTSAYNHKF